MEPQRYTIVSDNDGHDYVIPVGEDEQFYAWVDAMEDGQDYAGKDFEPYRLGGSLSLLSFTDPRAK
jgi:hypothetical protein